MLHNRYRSRSYCERGRRMENTGDHPLQKVEGEDFRRSSDLSEVNIDYRMVSEDVLTENTLSDDLLSLKLSGMETVIWILSDNKDECPSYIKMDGYIEEDLKIDYWASESADSVSMNSHESKARTSISSSRSIEVFPFYSPQTVRRKELQEMLPRKPIIGLNMSHYLGPILPSKQPRHFEWKRLLGNWTDPSNPPSNAKELLRSGCPSKHRMHAWNLLIIRRTSVRRRITQYAKAHAAGLAWANSKAGRESFEVKQINGLMVNTPDPALANQLRVRRVMLGLLHSLQITEFQYLHRLITAILPTLNDDEEATFWAMIALHDSILPQQYFHTGSRAAEDDGKILWSLVQMFAPELHRTLINMPQGSGKMALSRSTTLWRQTVLMGCFPQQLVWRLWDTMLFEGERMIFRYQLAVLRTLQPLFQCLDSVEGVERLLSISGDLVHDIEAITKIANDDLGAITGKLLTKLRRRIL